MTAEIALPLSATQAHRVSPAVLTLSDKGEIGVKAVDADNRVVFHPVKIVDTDGEGTWVTGLPEQVTLITVGQEYVGPGDSVRSVPEATIAATLKDRSEERMVGKTWVSTCRSRWSPEQK